MLVTQCNRAWWNQSVCFWSNKDMLLTGCWHVTDILLTCYMPTGLAYIYQGSAEQIQRYVWLCKVTQTWLSWLPTMHMKAKSTVWKRNQHASHPRFELDSFLVNHRPTLLPLYHLVNTIIWSPHHKNFLAFA